MKGPEHPSANPAQQSTPPDYGLDAPGVVRNLTLMGLGFLVVGLAALQVQGPWAPVAHVTGGFLVGGACFGVLEGLYMVWSSRVGKFKERERLLDLVNLRGDEQILDVGCGRGLILNAAARRLRTGQATGVDIWNQQDQSGNTPEATLENARREGVAGRVEIVTGDARSLPFPEGAFDVVVSSLALHNIYDRADRQQALREIIRVLKPGGRFALLDFRHVAEYATGLQQAGARDVRVVGPHLLMFPPVRIATGQKVR